MATMLIWKLEILLAICVLAWTFLGLLIFKLRRFNAGVNGGARLLRLLLAATAAFFLGMISSVAVLLLRRNASTEELWEVYLVLFGTPETSLLRFGIGLSYVILGCAIYLAAHIYRSLGNADDVPLSRPTEKRPPA